MYNEVARRLTDVMYVTHDDDECVCPPVKADDDWTPEPTLHPTPQPGDPTMKPTRAPTAAPTEVPVDLKIDASTTFNNFNCDTFNVVKSAFKKTTKISLAGGDDDLLSAISVSIEGCTDGTEEEESSRRARKLTETSAEIAWSAGVEDVQLLGKGNVDELFEDMEEEYDNAVDSGAFQETFEDEAESEGEDAVQAIAAISGIAVASFEEIVVVHSASPTRAPTRKKKSSDDDDGVDEGAQAGIGVGSAFGALFFFAVVYYFKKRYDEKGAPSMLNQDNGGISNSMSHEPTNWPTQGGSAAGTESESSVISPVTNEIRPSETSFTSTGSSISKNNKVQPENEAYGERAARNSATKAGKSSAMVGPDLSF